MQMRVTRHDFELQILKVKIKAIYTENNAACFKFDVFLHVTGHFSCQSGTNSYYKNASHRHFKDNLQ